MSFFACLSGPRRRVAFSRVNSVRVDPLSDRKWYPHSRGVRSITREGSNQDHIRCADMED